MSHLEKAVEQIRKDAQKDDDMKTENVVDLDPDDIEGHPAISTGSLMLNHLIGGTRTNSGDRQCPGFPVGKISEVFGKEGSGKTTVCLHACAEIQNEGGSAAYLDYEHAIVPSYAKSIGVSFDKDKFLLVQPETWEEGVKYIEKLAESGVDLIVVDSLAAMVPRKEMEAEISDERGGGIGLLARKMSKFLRRIVSVLAEHQVTLVFTNQERVRIKTNPFQGGPDYATPGGTATKFYTRLRLRLKKVKEFYEDDVVDELTGEKKRRPDRVLVRAKVIKTTVSSHQGMSGTYQIRFGEGIDNVSTLLKIAKHKDVVTRAGAWYYVTGPDGEEQKFQGMDALREGVMDDEILRAHVIEQVRGEMERVVQDDSEADAENGED